MGLDCHRCHENPDLQRHRGCINPTERPQHIMRDGTKLYICPGRVINKDIKNYIDLYYDYKKGYLPFCGTKQQQPAKLMDIFSLIERFEFNEQKSKKELIDRIAKDGQRK